MRKCLYTFFFCVVALCNIQAQRYNLEFNEPEFLQTPNPPFDGYIYNATWNVDNSNISFDSRDSWGAIVYPNHYFDGTAVVSCSYIYEYFYAGRTLVGTGNAYYYITFKSNNATLNKRELKMPVGKTEKLSYELEKSYGHTYKEPKMTWESSRDDVASVDKNGKVTAISEGAATITFDPVVGPPVTCRVTVIDNPPTAISLPATSTIKVGETDTLTLTLTPSDAYATISWKSSDEAIASVSKGVVTGKKTGKATITATTDNGLSAECKVTVEKGVVTITADTESGTYASGKTVKLSASRTDAEIYYTLDGKKPTTSSTKYTDPITLNKSVTLKAIATGSNYETSEVLTRQYQVTTLSVKSYWSEADIQPPVFIPSVSFSKPVSAYTNIKNVKLSESNKTIDGQTIIQDGVLYFVPDKTLSTGIYKLTIPENAVVDDNGEPNLKVELSFKSMDGYNMITHLSAGGGYSLAVRDNGSLWAWGYNDKGQLGDGTTVNRTAPQYVRSSAVQVYAGDSHSLAVMTDGTLWSWGKNDYGQLGNNNKYSKWIPVKILNGVLSASAGVNHSLAIKTDSTLWAWGYNGFGQLGDGTTTTRYKPVKITDGVAQISAGGSHSLAVKTDGSLWAWGYNGNGKLGDGTTTTRYKPVKITDGVAQVSAGYSHSLAVKTDGSLWAWGYNSQGQLGDGTTTDKNTPVKIMDDVACVSAGYYHSLAIKTDGSLWAWGQNKYGEIGDDTKTIRTKPTKIMDDVSQVSAGSFHSLAVKTGGSLWAWGYNGHGQLGDGTQTDRLTPVCVIRSLSKVSGVKTSQTKHQIPVGSQYLLLPVATPSNGCFRTLEFKSSNPQVATVSSRGIVEAMSLGSTTITITADSAYTATCVFEVKESQREVVISPSGYATFYDSKSAYSLPKGLSAQLVTNASNNKLTYKTVANNSTIGIVPKGTAVMLVSDTKRSGTYTLTAIESSETYSGVNLLRGSDEATIVEPNSNEYVYKLSYGPSDTKWSDVFGWYWGAENGGSFLIEGHKAWLVVPTSTATRGYTIDGDATDMMGLEHIYNEEAPIYDMQGRRIGAPRMSGIYIKNGKKIVIK